MCQHLSQYIYKPNAQFRPLHLYNEIPQSHSQMQSKVGDIRLWTHSVDLDWSLMRHGDVALSVAGGGNQI